jgi:glucose/arabinose dehydrogenase
MTDASRPIPARATGWGIRLLVATALALTTAACGSGADDAPDTPPPVVDVDPEPDPDPDPDPDQEPSAGEEPDAAEDEGGTSAAEPEPPPDPDLSVALELTEVATLDGPTAGAVGPDGVLYLADRAGTVHPLTDEGVGEAVVDISDETTTESERGLLGIAFAADDSELYLSSTDRDGASTLTAVPVVDGEVRADERRTVFRVSQPYANHNGGDVHVGPDGLLYLGLGDGGSAGDPRGAGQDLTTPLGALLRIDPQRGEPYAIPSSNPFVDVEGAAPEIFAYGLRNPWRFSFDPATDTLWIGDVGQDAREEINRVDLDAAAGANFGWNLMEGTTSFAGSEPEDHVAPIYEYETRGPQGCAVTGGVVYRGSAIPELTGVYLYADACNGSVRGLVVDADGQVVEQADLGVDGGQVVAFVPDADGEVYVLDLGGGVRRLEPA